MRRHPLLIMSASVGEFDEIIRRQVLVNVDTDQVLELKDATPTTFCIARIHSEKLQSIVQGRQKISCNALLELLVHTLSVMIPYLLSHGWDHEEIWNHWCLVLCLTALCELNQPQLDPQLYEFRNQPGNSPYRNAMDAGRLAKGLGRFGIALHVLVALQEDVPLHKLLEDGADINACNEFFPTALYIASSHGELSTVTLLLERGASLIMTTPAGIEWVALDAALAEGKVAVAQLLLGSKKAEGDIRVQSSRSLLIAAGVEDELLVRTLLEHGADVSTSDGFQWTALLNAARTGSSAAVRVLLTHGANIEASTLR